MSAVQKKKVIDQIDKELGKLLRLARNTRAMSQEELGSENGLTFQMIQKYERGINRISVSRLMHLSESLELPATWFIEKLGEDKKFKNQVSEIKIEGLGKKGAHELLFAYAKITDKTHRRFLRLIAALLAGHSAGGKNE